MSNISIIDTGYPNISNEGTQESTANRANSGSAITLKCNEISYERGVGTDSNTVLGRYYSDFDDGVAGNPVNHASNETPKINLSGVFDRKTAADMNLILELDKLCTTKGIKLIYYNDTCEFYKKHKKDISDLLKDALSNYGGKSTPLDIFGDKWDHQDPFCLDAENQNLLAWFAFEETARQFAADRLNIVF